MTAKQWDNLERSCRQAAENSSVEQAMIGRGEQRRLEAKDDAKQVYLV